MAGYNGYTNYETWAVCLWLDNDEGLYNESRDRARQTLVDCADDADNPTEDEINTAVHKTADEMKDWLQEMMPDLGASLWSDLLNAALSEVDWYEVAKTRLES